MGHEQAPLAIADLVDFEHPQYLTPANPSILQLVVRTYLIPGR